MSLCEQKRMEKGGESSEHVEEALVPEGDTEKAISVLESQIRTILTTTTTTTLNSTDLEAENALSCGRDLKIALDSCLNFPEDGISQKDGQLEKSSESTKTAFPGEEYPDDDWETKADLAPEELLSSQSLPDVSKPLVKEKVVEVRPPKRRGRGTFSYTAHGLHNNLQYDGPSIDNSDIETAGHFSESDITTKAVSYGTRHIVVLADFPPTTTTIDLEKLLKNFKDRGFVIRWVSDTVALAVFKSPTSALEVCNQIQWPFTMRVLDENDPLLNSIPPGDLEPPRERPKTSTSAATRLIAQGMGIKLPTTGFGSKELKKQEQARRNRIVSRQNMRDEAWGDDV